MGNPLPQSSADLGSGTVVMGLYSNPSGTEMDISSPSLTSLSQKKQSVFNSSDIIDKKRLINNIVWESVKYSIVLCNCGTTLKIPPCYINQPIKCPHCGKVHTIKKSA